MTSNKDPKDDGDRLNKHMTSIKVPKDDVDRLNVRDNLKLAMEADQKDSNAILLAAGKGRINIITNKQDKRFNQIYFRVDWMLFIIHKIRDFLAFHILLNL